MVTGLPGAAEVLGLALQAVDRRSRTGARIDRTAVPGVTVMVVVAVTVPLRLVAVNV
jgi:hypothetical protein